LSHSPPCPPTPPSIPRNWNLELKRKKPSFTRATVRSFGHLMVFNFLLFAFEECFLRSVQPLMLVNVIRFFADPGPDRYLAACLNAAGVVAASLWYVLCHHPACVYCFRAAIKVRVAWCTLMYRKALRLHNSAFRKTTVGQILNLM